MWKWIGGNSKAIICVILFACIPVLVAKIYTQRELISEYREYRVNAKESMSLGRVLIALHEQQIELLEEQANHQ